MSTVFHSKRRAVVLASVLGALLYGCADAAGPSDAAAREVFEDRLHDGLSKGTIRIKSFQKTSGPTNVPPGDTYVVAFRAEIECLKDYTGRYCGSGCKQGMIIRLEEGSGRTKIFYDTGDPSVTATQSGTNLTSRTDFTRTYGHGGRLLSYEEENKWAGLQFNKTWRGWESFSSGKLY